MKIDSDIDIDFGDRDKLLQLIKHTSAAMRNVKPMRKHATGVYVTDIPYDPVNNMASIDYTVAEKRGYFKLDLLNGDKKVVLGNHDMWQDVPELMKYVKGVSGMVDYKGYVLTHAPIHPSEIGQYRGNIHAHIHHNNKLMDMVVNRMYADKENNPIINTNGKYYNVDAYLLDFKPVTLKSLNKQD
jgi:calcineurin-like phosphoesterase family protein